MLRHLLFSPLALALAYVCLVAGVLFWQRVFLFDKATPAPNRRRRAVELVACLAAAAGIPGILLEAPQAFFAVGVGVMVLALIGSLSMSYVPDPATGRTPDAVYGTFGVVFAALALCFHVLSLILLTSAF